MVRAAEHRRRSYELVQKALKVSFATLALILGFTGLIFVANFMLTSVSSMGAGPGPRESSASWPFSSASDLMRTVIWIFTIFVGAVIAVAYSMYVIDVLRSRPALGGPEDEVV